MKISKQLQSNIREQIRGAVTYYLIQLDALDRSQKISHEAWQLTHKPACGLSVEIEDAVIRAIELYRK